MNVLISMIVPLYHGNKYIFRLLRMFEDNCDAISKEYEGYEYELILVNDSPEDQLDSLKLINIQNVIIINNNENVGIHRSKVNGLKQAQGEYIVFLDQDDLICPDFFRLQYDRIGNGDAVVCNADTDNGSIYSQGQNEALNVEMYKRGENGIISLGQMMIKKSSIPDEWHIDLSAHNSADDLFLIYMMILMNRSIHYHNSKLYYHTHTASNVSLDIMNISESVIEVYEKLYDFRLISYGELKDVTEYRNNQIQDYNKIKSQYSEVAYKQRNMDIRTFYLYDRLLTNLEQGYWIDGYLKTLGIKNVAVYGAGKMGEHFINWLRKCETHIVYVIDKYKKGTLLDAPIIDIESAIDYKDEYDAIIVTPIDNNVILKEMSSLLKIPIFCLEEVVYNMKSIEYLNYSSMEKY